MYFFDRQHLLRILYHNLKRTERVLLKKKVSGVKLVSGGGGFRVHCTDGSIYKGTVVVGADGVHSVVRSVMRSLADKLEQSYFDPAESETEVECHYRCSFGIAKHVPGWEKGEDHTITGNSQSQLVLTAPRTRSTGFHAISSRWQVRVRHPNLHPGGRVPFYGAEPLGRLGKKFLGASGLDSVPLSNRSKEVLFDDELPPTGRNVAGGLV
ncbi:FAD binding domain protein [Apiospora marii]|uniref:FAD binding domain protein n=1 Tax=Apiospora marii TaxID=335849 RepID=A0ABR1RU71_9PEZI